MVMMVSSKCQNCGKLLELTSWVLRPGQVRTTTCPNCGQEVTIQSDPAFKDASIGMKALYGLAFIKTVGILIGGGILVVASLNNSQYGMALTFAVFTVGFLWATNSRK